MSSSRALAATLALSLVAASLSTGCFSTRHRTTAYVVNAATVLAGGSLLVGVGSQDRDNDVPFDEVGIALGAGLALVGTVGLFATASTEPTAPDAPAPLAPAPVAMPVLAPLPEIAGANADAVRLAKQARILAAAGNCAAARMTARRVAAIDRGYHGAALADDAVLARCR